MFHPESREKCPGSVAQHEHDNDGPHTKDRARTPEAPGNRPLQSGTLFCSAIRILEAGGEEKSRQHTANRLMAHLVRLGSKKRTCRIEAAHDAGPVVNSQPLERRIKGDVTMEQIQASAEGYSLQGGEPRECFSTLESAGCKSHSLISPATLPGKTASPSRKRVRLEQATRCVPRIDAQD